MNQQTLLKRSQNAKRTLGNFQQKRQRLRTREAALILKMESTEREMNKKKKRTDLIRTRAATKAETVKNNEKYIEKRRLFLEVKTCELAKIQRALVVFDVKIKKKRGC